MGSYLEIGILTEITIPKQVYGDPIDIEGIQQSVFRKFLLDSTLYTIQEQENSYCMTLNLKVLQSNISLFLQKQKSSMKVYTYMQEEWESLQSLLNTSTTLEGILAIANQRRFINFQSVEIYDYVETPFRSLNIRMKMISYHSEGKILAEEFMKTAHYLMTLIRHSDPSNPLVNTVIVAIQ
ncbi:hypothetical protein ACT7DC_02615 [Bacillus cereus]